MPPSKKRKITPTAEPPADTNPSSASPPPSTKDTESQPNPLSSEAHSENHHASSTDPSTTTTSTNTSPPTDRAARFAALRARATASARSNLTAATEEANRSAIDPSLLTSLSRRADIARHNLLKADTEADSGTGSFERKRAWDYTIEDSERWDERLAAKKERKEGNAFQDYGAEAGKIYDRQIREMERLGRKEGGRLRKDYDASKRALLEDAARNGGLEIVEMEDGEMVAIDNEGRFYASEGQLGDTSFVEQKPKKENVDRLVEDLRKAEEVRMRKRAERGGKKDEGDVTYINEKNKQFNAKLGRFYDRYTVGIREAFERGTAL